MQSILVHFLPNKKLNYFFEAIDFKNWFTNEFIEFLDTACEVILMKQLLIESHNMFLNKNKPWMLNNQNNLHKYILLVLNTNDKSFIFQNTNDVFNVLKTKLLKWNKINIDMRLYSNFDFNKIR
ncbi:hypothetical protein [Spiroplasma endosymbiont of Nebria brevicollis]|uniref:hypothetical protein n=1 Tax=Spiroplasma endosymbiont of Nebria brevicollis TaxID=3066284 RepID=UPI00313C75C1